MISQINKHPLKGSVFVLSLWILAALSVYAIGLSENVRQKTFIYQRLSAKEIARDILEGAIKRTIEELRQGNASKTAIWYNPSLYSKTISFDQGSVRLEIEDITGRINVNEAEAYVLESLIQERTSLGQKEANKLACAIIDFRDEDDFMKEDYDRGSEREAYRHTGLTRGPKNSPFEYSSELLQVPGMTKEIYVAIKNYITIYGGGSLNINTATKEALMAIGLPTLLVDKIVKLRGQSAESGEGSFVFKNTDRIQEDLAHAYELSIAERTALDHATQYAGLTVNPGCYKIKATATLSKLKLSGEVLCFYSPTGGIQAWVET